MLSQKLVSSRISDALTNLVKTMQPNGAVLVAINNDVIYEQYFGFAEVGKKALTTLHTEYLIASVTKQFTAAALLNALYEKAKDHSMHENESEEIIKIALQKPIVTYLPANHKIWVGLMPDWAEVITLHQLLIHSSGIPSYTRLPNFGTLRELNASDLIAFLKSQSLEFTPGTKYSYSDSGYFLLGIIIQEISNQSLDKYVQENFFKPLEMHSSFLPTSDIFHNLKQSGSRFTNLACGHILDLAAIDPKIIEIDNSTSMFIPVAAGGIISTTRDLLKWNNALYTGKIVPLFLVNLMLQPYIQSENDGEYYGYGIEIKSSQSFGKYYRHPGGIPGFKARLTYIPQWQISIVMLENIYGHHSSLMPEIEIIKSGLPATLSEADKIQQASQILETRHPDIIKNRKCYQLTPLEDSIVAVLENLLSKDGM